MNSYPLSAVQHVNSTNSPCIVWWEGAKWHVDTETCPVFTGGRPHATLTFNTDMLPDERRRYEFTLMIMTIMMYNRINLADTTRVMVQGYRGHSELVYMLDESEVITIPHLPEVNNTVRVMFTMDDARLPVLKIIVDR